jgi:hypothetical protein
LVGSIYLDPSRGVLSVRILSPLWSRQVEEITDVRYQFALGPPARSLVTSIALARFILHDELVPAFTCANLMGCKYFDSPPRRILRGRGLTDSVGRGKGRDSVDFGRLPPGSHQYGQ